MIPTQEMLTDLFYQNSYKPTQLIFQPSNYRLVVTSCYENEFLSLFVFSLNTNVALSAPDHLRTVFTTTVSRVGYFEIPFEEFVLVENIIPSSSVFY